MPTDLQSNVNPFENLHIKRPRGAGKVGASVGKWGPRLLKDALCCQERVERKILYPDCHLAAIDWGVWVSEVCVFSVCVWGLHTFIKHYLLFTRILFYFPYFLFAVSPLITAAVNLHNIRRTLKSVKVKMFKIYSLERAIGNINYATFQNYISKLWHLVTLPMSLSELKILKYLHVFYIIWKCQILGQSKKFTIKD